MNKLIYLFLMVFMVSCGTVNMKDVADQANKSNKGSASDSKGSSTEAGSDRCTKELTRLIDGYLAKKGAAAATSIDANKQVLETMKQTECAKGTLDSDCLEKKAEINKPEDINSCRKKK